MRIGEFDYDSERHEFERTLRSFTRESKRRRRARAVRVVLIVGAVAALVLLYLVSFAAPVLR